jgi:mono/diheme cytochrome c family protein
MMRRAISIHPLLPTLLLTVACGSDSGTEGPPTDDGGPEPTALACEVAAIVEPHCSGCHGDPLRSGAPQELLTLEDWRAPAPTLPSQTNGQLSVARMGDAGAPMPPAGLLSEEERAVIADWVAAGMPGGDCEPATLADPALDAAPACTSMDLWPAPNHHALGKTDAEMFPGMPCTDCHLNPFDYGQPEGGPAFDIGGTVYPTAHEPDNCAGIDGLAFADVVVHIEDANGATWDLTPNAAGNFYLQFSGLVPPYSAKVISANGVRAMSLRPSSGDCNLCHTEQGSSGPDPQGPVAPGRIVVP